MEKLYADLQPHPDKCIKTDVKPSKSVIPLVASEFSGPHFLLSSTCRTAARRCHVSPRRCSGRAEVGGRSPLPTKPFSSPELRSCKWKQLCGANSHRQLLRLFFSAHTHRNFLGFKTPLPFFYIYFIIIIIIAPLHLRGACVCLCVWRSAAVSAVSGYKPCAEEPPARSASPRGTNSTRGSGGTSQSAQESLQGDTRSSFPFSPFFFILFFIFFNRGRCYHRRTRSEDIPCSSSSLTPALPHSSLPDETRSFAPCFMNGSWAAHLVRSCFSVLSRVARLMYIFLSFSTRACFCVQHEWAFVEIYPFCEDMKLMLQHENVAESSIRPKPVHSSTTTQMISFEKFCTAGSLFLSTWWCSQSAAISYQRAEIFLFPHSQLCLSCLSCQHLHTRGPGVSTKGSVGEDHSESLSSSAWQLSGFWKQLIRGFNWWIHAFVKQILLGFLGSLYV